MDIVMLMYNLIEYSCNYSKTFRSFWQYYKDELHESTIVYSESFNSKIRIQENRKTRKQ